MKKQKKKLLVSRISLIGKSEIPLLLVVVGFGFILAGGLLTAYHPGQYSYQSIQTQALCCDSGNGDACRPSTVQAFDYVTAQGEKITYGLLKSNTELSEGGIHLEDTGQKYQGHPILLNVSDGYRRGDGSYECGQGKYDQISTPNKNNRCVPIPNDEIMYVCKKNCPAQTSMCPVQGQTNSSPCFGDKTTVYDIFFRMADIPTPGVPEVIKNCQMRSITSAPISIVPQQTVVPGNPYPSHASLQLHTFGFASPIPSPLSSIWISPYCKPAIYLYPERQEAVKVVIAPKGELKETIPRYQKQGWNVIAYPDGTIIDNNKSYNYLFYEAQIPDSLIPQEPTGYVVEYKKLKFFFDTMLPQFGLNQKEQEQFATYWLKALPKNPYYRISLIPEQTLQTISPLSISPNPQTLIRVDLQFQPLDKKISLTPPSITPPTRSGFTVVEWGGLFKQDKKHPFTCLM